MARVMGSLLVMKRLLFIDLIEHGLVDISACTRKPKIGDRLEVIPNHVCVVSNLHDEVVLQRQGKVEAIVPVLARGKTR
ncbi:MAG: hypothetical protein R2865_04685 [Deinococcales bacterium]